MLKCDQLPPLILCNNFVLSSTLLTIGLVRSSFTMTNMNTAPINDTTPPTASTAAYLSKTNKMTDPPSAAMIWGTQSAKFSVAKNSPNVPNQFIIQ
jgi:hypothetical protein